jgi:hypothetical protein
VSGLIATGRRLFRRNVRMLTKKLWPVAVDCTRDAQILFDYAVSDLLRDF